METKLVTCPFCGKSPTIETDGLFIKWFISCDNELCNINPETKRFKSKNAAIEAWNNRSETVIDFNIIKGK